MTLKRYLVIFAISIAVLFYIAWMVYSSVTWLPQHWLAELLFYPVAGLAWIIPLRFTIFRKPTAKPPADS